MYKCGFDTPDPHVKPARIINVVVLQLDVLFSTVLGSTTGHSQTLTSAGQYGLLVS